jgi:hypothetical protein
MNAYSFIQYEGEQKKQSQINLNDHNDAWRFANQLFEGSPDAIQLRQLIFTNNKTTIRITSKEEMLYKIQSV